ncbi:MAG: M61 family peptidase [Bacteroidetes bacterium]|nr:MAG: M61 family peptidase [Bacteroidota bacterium]
MKYQLSIKSGNSRFLSINGVTETEGRKELYLQLPAWRPGRYEIGNFAKNIRLFAVSNEAGEALTYTKVNKDRWLISCDNAQEVRVSYEYYAATLDAGSTYCGIDLMYVNPVNCIMYDEAKANQAFTVSLDIPDDWQIACSMHQEAKTLHAVNFDELADSPFIASPNLEHHVFETGGCDFHVWFNGKHKLDVPRFLEEAKQYTDEQLKVFGDMESKSYHYLFHFLPTRVHHGVEHLNSTVIVMGPGDEFAQEGRHHEFLAISSHELFHYWNIKRIRPKSMFPYDYTKENYSQLGYVYEGVTTYYGDYMLLRSGVFSFEDYLGQLNTDLQKHFDNEGRYNYSVAESSWDTWLDGYVPGVPGRKNSIYTEGMLSALMLDIEIRYATGNQKSLDDVMRSMYEDYKKGKAYDRDSYKATIEHIAGKDMEYFFRDFYEGRGNIEKFLPETLWSIGCELVAESSPWAHESLYGFKMSEGQKLLVSVLCSNSPAEQAGLNLGDEIVLVNNVPVTGGTDWNDVFSTGGSLMAWNTIEGSKHVELLPNGTQYLKRYRLKKLKEVSDEQKSFFKAWSGHDF